MARCMVRRQPVALALPRRTVIRFERCGVTHARSGSLPRREIRRCDRARTSVLMNTSSTELEERLTRSEEGRRTAWQVLQNLRAVLEVVADEPYPKERSFRAEGRHLVMALWRALSSARRRIHDLEVAARLMDERLRRAGIIDHGVATFHALQPYRPAGLSPEELQARLDQLRELGVVQADGGDRSLASSGPSPADGRAGSV